MRLRYVLITKRLEMGRYRLPWREQQGRVVVEVEAIIAKRGMPIVTLYGWMYRGRLKTRRVNGRRLAFVDGRERACLRRLRRENPSPTRHALAKAV